MSYRTPYRVLVGLWLIGDLYWFASVLMCIRQFFKYSNEVQTPLDVALSKERTTDEYGQKRVNAICEFVHFDNQ